MTAMDVPQSSLRVAYNILAASLFAFISYLFARPVHGHKFSIGRFNLSGAHDIKYEATIASKTYSFTFTAASLTWRVHRPRSTDPRWCTITCDSIFYTSTTGDISTARLEVVLWFFPVYFRQTAGPWADINIDGLRIRVCRSTETPYFVQRLRENLVGTFLTGEILRADVFRTTFRFAGLTQRPESKSQGYTKPEDMLQSEDPTEDAGDDESTGTSGDDGYASAGDDEGSEPEEEEFHTKPLTRYDDDEMAFNALARTLHINNRGGRIYTFGRIDSQIRRDWMRDRGSLVLIAEECRWVRVPFPFERVAPRTGIMQLLSSFLHSPIDLVRTFNLPVSNTNLYITRVDVTFDTFRLRDAELLKQGFSLIHEKTITSGIDWSDAFLDAIMYASRPARGSDDKHEETGEDVRD
ncbi:hypothetical protein K466DRAFT_341903 [Polyporus arcularius HHB13444]|uniref:Uncharacterized protein n=1 Tax=Polyporus arcularius HHB13444 TaxID=1314778 RepID=A0A5C3NWC3_9APHY|nr:hypothetical protein K466DRAFT_341903 [Polyporus arcularius HHB13444]